jgi:hypothetical protein
MATPSERLSDTLRRTLEFHLADEREKLSEFLQVPVRFAEAAQTPENE